MQRINKHLVILGILLSWMMGTYGQGSPGGYVYSASINDSLASPVRMAIDNADNIYVTDPCQKKIKKFNAAGIYIGSIITSGSPVSIAINAANQVFIGDGETGKILRLNTNGTTTELYAGTVFPSSMVFCSDGFLYVSDSKLQRVIVLDLSGNVIRTIGAGTLTYPTGIAFDKKNNRILVAEHGGIGTGFNPVVKIRIYGLTGNLITSFGSHGNGDGKFYRIQGMAVGRCGEIYVPEPYQGNVSVFNENTIFATRFGQYGDSISQLRVPLDIAVNSQDKIFITAENNGTIEVYNINYMLPTANITFGNKTICAGTTTEIPVHFTGTAPWTFTYTVNGTNPATVFNTMNNPYILTVSAPGNYQVTAVSDSSHTGTCFSGNSVVTVNNVLPTATMMSGNFGFCPGQMASVPITFTGVAPWTFTYTVNGTNPQTVSNIAGSPYLLNVSDAGNYQISAVTGGGCTGSTFSGNAIVSANASPNAVITSGNVSICAGSSTNMMVGFTGTAPWSFTYTINNANQTTIDNIVENPYQFPVSLAGVYKIIQVQDAFCLSAVSSSGTELVVKPLPTSDISSGNAAICAGDSTNIIVDLTGTSPWSFNYTINGLNPTTISGVTSSPWVLPVSQAGTYQLTSLSDAGCIGTVMTGVAAITLNPLPLVSLGAPAAICPGDSTVISPGPGFLHYFWSDSTTGPTLTVYSAGNYSVTVTDFNGCRNSASKTVTSSTMPTSAITSGNAAICMGATTDISIALTGTPPWTITYTVNNLIQQSVSNINTSPYLLNVYQPGLYQVIQTTDALCSNPVSSGSALITVNPLPTYNFSSGNATICPGQSTSLVIDFTGTPPWNFTYTINGINPVTFNGINTSPWVMQVSQSGTYEITALSDAFCTGPAYNGTATVIQNPLPNVNLGPDVTLCDGDTVTLDAGSSFAGYLWNNGNTSQTIDVGLPGNYSVIVTDYNGCTNSDGLNVSLVSPPVSLFTSSSNGLMLSLFNASLNATSYLWTFGDNTTSIETNPVHTYQAAGTYLVSLAASNGICGDSITSQSIDIVLTSTGGPTLENLLRLYPNPSTGIVTIEIDNPNKLDLNIEINDIAGRQIYSRAMNTMKFKETIDLGTFASGFYMVKLSAGSITKISKLVLID